MLCDTSFHLIAAAVIAAIVATTAIVVAAAIIATKFAAKIDSFPTSLRLNSHLYLMLESHSVVNSHNSFSNQCIKTPKYQK